jgi:hypothetical protein
MFVKLFLSVWIDSIDVQQVLIRTGSTCQLSKKKSERKRKKWKERNCFTDIPVRRAAPILLHNFFDVSDVSDVPWSSSVSSVGPGCSAAWVPKSPNILKSIGSKLSTAKLFSSSEPVVPIRGPQPVWKDGSRKTRTVWTDGHGGIGYSRWFIHLRHVCTIQKMSNPRLQFAFFVMSIHFMHSTSNLFTTYSIGRSHILMLSGAWYGIKHVW